MKFNTLVIHGGIDGDKHTGAVTVPIYQTSTFKQKAPGEHTGFEYSRTANPTRLALEKLVADLENGYQGFAFSSGMAAISSVIMLFKSGDHLIFSDDLYGGTRRVVDKVFNNLGITYSFVDTSSLDKIEKAITSQTKAIYIETPTNPLMKVTDIKAVSTLAQKYNLITIVDNTFMTPYLQKPLDLGADIVLHSATKYLGGHSDLVAGVVVVNSQSLGERLHFVQNSVGAILGPQDSWLLIKGIKTLALRMERHCENAVKVVEHLKRQSWVTKIYYPGIGGMLSFEVINSEVRNKLLSNLKTFTLAESLGGVESLISVPALMTHLSVPKEILDSLGITENLIRVSVGIEDIEDIILDLQL
ncbi:aminotransferase class I/II-fold pyridoxal phosphate-dependent enzyme [Anaerobranca gottschalkii]|uniref:Cystathionine beta-lyase n=1 Tax=Anaerobranca gottschalkii DSM 13577 TaxID=1120990 RepID=A0A1I0AB85_9FIRM|nr:aminotransferase class I/II-fold pyridoxal phosphate-dependent enzyme [Anaerobranca gottschalkii]SES91295.1 cystathionine beta-lyase [Anaerobranca gottschalkii DSM 13577]